MYFIGWFMSVIIFSFFVLIIISDKLQRQKDQMMSITLILILIGCGIITNIMSAIFGIGGGVLMVPILYTLFPEFPLQMVAATSLTIVMGSSMINLVYFYRQK